MILKSKPAHIALFILGVLFAGCKEEEPPLPEAPAGTKTFGTERHEVGSAIIALPGGGYLIGGATENAEHDWDAYLMEVDAAGEKLREKTFPDTENKTVIRSIKTASTGDYLMAAISQNTDSDIEAVLMVVDIDFNLLQEFRIPFSTSYYAGSLTPSYAEAFEMSDGGWMMHVNHGGSIGIFRLGTDGTLTAWRYVTAEVARVFIPAKEFLQDANGDIHHFIVRADYNGTSFTLNKLDPATTFPAQAISLSLDSIYDPAYYYQMSMGASTLLPNGNMLFTIATSGQYNHIVEVNPFTGNIPWIKRLNIREDLFLVKRGSDGKIHLAGQTATQGYSPVVGNALVATLDSTGGNLRRRSYGGPQSEVVGGMDIGTDGTTAVIGSTSSYGAGGSDIFLILYN